jgi:cytochrome oxidase Cu insertion factor (SCO1/SenC/PrrC family)
MSSTTRWALGAAVPLVAVAAVALAFVLRSSASPEHAAVVGGAAGTTWAAGERRAPPLRLRSPEGRPLDLSALRGRRVIVTFTDPHCTTFCPRESFVIDDVLRTLPAAERPAVVAVSVDPTVTSPRVFGAEARRFRWLPQWRWATGTPAELRAAWRRYGITVLPTKGDITHTEAAYFVDARGYERALLLWPFGRRAVAQALAAAS